jgi:hypothetical protein
VLLTCGNAAGGDSGFEPESPVDTLGYPEATRTTG